MQKKIYNRLLKERTSKMQKISDEINYDDLIYYFKRPSSPVSFNEYEDPSDLHDKIKNGDKTIQAAEEEQTRIKSRLGEITSGNPEHKSTNQSYAIKNAQNLYNSRQKLLIYLTIMKQLDSKLFLKQNKIKVKEQDLKY